MFEYMVEQPKQLKSLALAALGAWVAAVAERLRAPISQLAATRAARAEAALSRHIHTIRLYFEHNIPKALYDKFSIEVIRALTRLLMKTEAPKKLPPKLLSYLKSPPLCRPISGTNVARRMIEILFTTNLSFLTLDDFQWEMFGASFYTKSHMLPGLAHFKLDIPLRWAYRRIDIETDIIRFLKGIHSIQYLSISTHTRRILKCIANSCTFIKELHVAEVTEKDIETILLFCDNIEHFIIYDGLCLKQVLEMCYAKNGGKQFKLKTYSGHSDTLAELRAVVQMCPLIQRIELNKGFNRRESNLLALIDLRDVRELTLMGYEFYDDQVREILQVIGNKLEQLRLQEVSEIDLSALKHISQTCPNLESLAVDVCKDMVHSPCMEKMDIPPFRNLKKLILKVLKTFPGAMPLYSRRLVSFRPEVIDEKTFFFLLSSCVYIEYIKLGVSVGFTDDMMLKYVCVLDINTFAYMKELVVWHPLTATVIDRIIENCSANVILLGHFVCSYTDRVNFY